MAITVKKRDGEPTSTLVYRFSKKVRQSGILREARKRRFHQRPENKNRRRRSALHREKKRTQIEKEKKLGTFWK